MDTRPLQDAYAAFLEVADTAARTAAPGAPATVGEWDADQILAHVCLVDAATIAAAAAVAAGRHTTYDNRVSQDPSTLDQVRLRAGDSAGLRERVRHQGEALGILASEILSEPELDTLVPTRLTSAGTLLVDAPVRLRALISGLADDHLPRHAEQLMALVGREPGRPPAVGSTRGS